MTETDIKDIVEDINDIRKMSKNEWYYYTSVKFGIKLKAFGTWIQRIERGQFQDGSPMGMTVIGFKNWLANWLKGTDNYVTT